jgi:2'-5' RNA ligase
MRAFVAIDPDEQNREFIYNIAALFNNLYEGNPVKKQNYHLTLFFFGNLHIVTLNTVKNILGEINASPFKITLDHVNCFYSKGSPRVCFVGGKSLELEAIFNYIKSKLNGSFIHFDDKPFKVHLTLFRIKYIRNLGEFTRILSEINNSFNALNFMVNSVILYSSSLTKSGPSYNIEFVKHLISFNK